MGQDAGLDFGLATERRISGDLLGKGLQLRICYQKKLWVPQPGLLHLSRCSLQPPSSSATPLPYSIHVLHMHTYMLVVNSYPFPIVFPLDISLKRRFYVPWIRHADSPPTAPLYTLPGHPSAPLAQTFPELHARDFVCKTLAPSPLPPQGSGPLPRPLPVPSQRLGRCLAPIGRWGWLVPGRGCDCR